MRFGLMSCRGFAYLIEVGQAVNNIGTFVSLRDIDAWAITNKPWSIALRERPWLHSDSRVTIIGGSCPQVNQVKFVGDAGRPHPD